MLLQTNRVVSKSARSHLACRRSLNTTTGSFRLLKKFVTPLSKGPGMMAL